MDTSQHPPSARPVPQAIWPCDPLPAEQDRLPELAERVTSALLRRVLAEFAQPRDTAVLVGIDPATLTAAQDFDFAALPATPPPAPTTPRPPAGGGAHGSHAALQPGSVGLIVAAIANPAAGGDAEPYRSWRRLLRPGGTLVVLSACPAGAVRFANNAGLIVCGATAAGLVYQQHIVAIHARIANSRLHPPPGPQPDPGPDRPAVQVPVHSDVLVFTNPRLAQPGTAR